MERSCMNVAINSKMLVKTPLPFVSVHPHTAALILKGWVWVCVFP